MKDYSTPDTHLIIKGDTLFDKAFNFASIGMAIISLDGNWLKVNKAFCELLGYPEEELLQTNFQLITHPEDLEKDMKLALQVMEGKLDHYQIEKRYLHKRGNVIWALLNISLVRSESGVPIYVIGQVQDINHQKKTEEQLRFYAEHDVLTGLLNRVALEQYIELALTNARNTQNTALMAVMFLDLDGFKKINDTLGHLAGDKILIEFAWRLSQALRKADKIARFGGDEFIVFLQGLSAKSELTSIAEKLLQAIHKPYVLNEETLHVGASIGIACYPESGNSLEQLLKNADLALLRAKEVSRGRFEFYTEKFGVEFRKQFLFERELHEAINKKQLFLLFQPKFELKTRKMIGVEALLRWQHPQLGLVMPDKFIPIAEKSNFISLLGQWVLENACFHLASWRKKQPNSAHLTLAINLSSYQLQHYDFSEKVVETLKDHDIPAKQIEFELAEQIIHQQDDKILSRLHAHSIQLVIDDFGTGNAFLYQLKDLPVSSLKLDKSYVQNFDKVGGNADVIKSVITLGRELGIKVIAEGIETEAQLNFLVQQGCLQGLGHYLSKPLSSEELGAYMATQSN